MKIFFTTIGKSVTGVFQSWRDNFAFLGEVTASLALLFYNPRKLRWSSFA